MLRQIPELLALQASDMRVKDLQTRLSLIPGEKDKLKNSLEAEKGALKDCKDRLQKNELAIKKVESDIKQKNQHILDLQGKSAMVKKNDEYQAMMNEIKNAKDRISDFETDEITLLDAASGLKEEMKKHEKTFSTVEKSVMSEVKELDELAVQLKAEIENVKQGRQALSSKVPQDLLGPYNRLLVSGKGSAPLVKIHQGSCGSCHLKLPPQTINQARKDSLVFCDNCFHMLYLEDDVLANPNPQTK
jgi:predicted  nucleic acid-binding Zn-ribbon protein